MENKIETLIKEGKLKDALSILYEQNTDAAWLSQRLNNAERQFNLGLIEFSEWGRTQAQISFAALEMAAKLQENFSPTYIQVGEKFVGIKVDPQTMEGSEIVLIENKDQAFLISSQEVFNATVEYLKEQKKIS